FALVMSFQNHGQELDVVSDDLRSCFVTRGDLANQSWKQSKLSSEHRVNLVHVARVGKGPADDSQSCLLSISIDAWCGRRDRKRGATCTMSTKRRPEGTTLLRPLLRCERRYERTQACRLQRNDRTSLRRPRHLR